MYPKDLKEKPTLGFIGLGAIGLPIAANLIRADFPLQVHTRSRKAEKSPELKGAKPCSTPKEVAQGCEVLLICVSDDKAVEEVLFGFHGAESNLTSGKTVIDLSTISPTKAKSFAAKLARKNVKYIDAPVTGGTEGAKKGTLTIFLGTNDDSLKEVSSILQPIGSSFYPFGTVGKGQEVKAINQILVAGSYAAVAEAISLGEALNLPMDIVVEALQKGAASSWALSNRSQSMLQDNYPLGFKLHLHHKDLCIALKTAEDSGLKLPITSNVKELEERLIKEGYKDLDVSVLKRSIKNQFRNPTDN
ncbi:NAD(P)-dependent oxidoreductase [Prochlorococcus marinus]|uniref:NAD(P)-dependent oxidoreductase n=1 Tax=Prochlorococcus marinus TaxID=1219 RepID=UPI0022B30A7A|nr:NAD(P)-dependent oxidoreductase [Prochlorococcus marinus]